MLNLSCYRTFIEVYQEQSIVLAAKQLNLSASAVSKQIAQLEAHLGVQLFVRKTRQLQATARGAQFYQDSVAILRMLEQAEQRVNNTSALSERLSISLSSALTESTVMTQLGEFAQQNPSVCLTIQVSEHLQDLSDSGLDAAFRIGKTGNAQGLVALALKQVRPVFIATPQYLKRYGKADALQDLKQHSLVIPPLKNLTAEVRQYLDKSDILNCFARVHYVDEITAIASLVRSHQCIGFHLNFGIEHSIADHTLLPVLPDIMLPEKTLYFVYKKQSYPLESMQQLKAFIKQQYGIN